MGKQKQGGKGSKKYGRNEAKCKAYKAEGRRDKNKARKLAKHRVENPNDKVAANAVTKIADRRWGR
jgi:hypothetical protein